MIALKEEVEKLENLKTPKKNAEYETRLLRRTTIMNTKIMKAMILYARIKRKRKTGKNLGKMRRLFGAVEEEQSSLKSELPHEYAAFKGLSGGAFYEKPKKEIENIIQTIPCSNW